MMDKESDNRSNDKFGHGGRKKISSESPEAWMYNSESDSEEDILTCLRNLGLSDKQNCLVLTPGQHYYYNEEDLSNIKTLVNLKKLNLIKDPDKFLHNLYRILPSDSSFIGCFTESGNKARTDIHTDKSTGLLNWFINLLEKRSEHPITRNSVNELLESHGFRVFDMKQVCGLTFFYSRNVRKQVNNC